MCLCVHLHACMHVCVCVCVIYFFIFYFCGLQGAFSLCVVVFRPLSFPSTPHCIFYHNYLVLHCLVCNEESPLPERERERETDRQEEEEEEEEDERQ